MEHLVNGLPDNEIAKHECKCRIRNLGISSIGHLRSNKWTLQSLSASGNFTEAFQIAERKLRFKKIAKRHLSQFYLSKISKIFEQFIHFEINIFL